MRFRLEECWGADLLSVAARGIRIITFSKIYIHAELLEAECQLFGKFLKYSRTVQVPRLCVRARCVFSANFAKGKVALRMNIHKQIYNVGGLIPFSSGRNNIWRMKISPHPTSPSFACFRKTRKSSQRLLFAGAES